MGEGNGEPATHKSESGTVQRIADRRLDELVATGLLTDTQVRTAIAEQRRTRRSLVRTLVDLGYLDEERLPVFLARWRGLPFVDLNEYAIDAAASALVPLSLARRHQIVPIGFEDEKLVVALADPTDIIVVDDIRLITGRDVKVVVATRTDIDDALARLAAADRTDLLEEPEDDDQGPTALESAAQDAPIVKAVNRIISQAVTQRASDIHVEPEERHLRIRFRIDGVLHDVMRIPKGHQAGVVSRLKVMADADIAEKRMPQDGRISLRVDEKHIDLRVSTLPSVHGEEISLRILDRSTSLISLAEMGFSDEVLASYEKVARKGFGAILVTGPTGSGKSTTMYATLNILNDPTRKIVTIEDPVEYRIAGLRQIQTHSQIGLTFAHTLRSVLRSDPDVLMIGEIRDRETASIAINAAMTGHLVLTTLHTMNAASALPRLVEMGVDPFLVASAVTGVLAQRLVRRLCTRCSEPAELPEETLDRYGLRRSGAKPDLRRAVGCRYCAGTGYRGRLAIAEIVVVTEEIERIIADRGASDDIHRAALGHGGASLLEDGLDKVRSGLTSLEEVLRVIG